MHTNLFFNVCPFCGNLFDHFLRSIFSKSRILHCKVVVLVVGVGVPVMVGVDVPVGAPVMVGWRKMRAESGKRKAERVWKSSIHYSMSGPDLIGQSSFFFSLLFC